MYKKEFMEIAISEAREGILNRDGGPFGAAVVKNGVNCVRTQPRAFF